MGGAFGGVMGGVTKGLSSRSRQYVPEEALVADEAVSSAEVGAKPYRVAENPHVAVAAKQAGVDVAAVSEPQFELMNAAERALATGDAHGAVAIGDSLVNSGLSRELVTKFESALAKSLGTTDPAVYRNPSALLPDGTATAPSAYGGELFYGTDAVPPSVAFERGFPARGSNVKLLDHVHQGGDTAFRGTTRSIVSPDGDAGAGLWAGEDGWVYKIDGTPSFDVNAKLEGRVPKPDGSFGNNPLPGEHEQAVLANIPRERIVGAYKMIERNGRLVPGPFEANPNYKASQ